MTDGQMAPWVRIASYKGLDGDLQADLLVANLQGHDIPAIRLPWLTTTNLPMASYPMIRPAQVLVPPTHAAEAAELVQEQVSYPMRPKLRRVLQWWLVTHALFLLGAPIEFPNGTAAMAGQGALLVLHGAAIVLMALAFASLLAELFREGRLRLDIRPLIAATLVYGVAALLAWPFWLTKLPQSPRSEQIGRLWLAMAAYAGAISIAWALHSNRFRRKTGP